MNADAEALIARLGLAPLPHEGGFFRQTWTSPTHLPGGRSAGSAILFVLTDTDFSALHRMPTDELWFSHAGDPVEHVQLLHAPGQPVITCLGDNPLEGHTPQLIVRGGNWQGARILPRNANHSSRDSMPTHGWSLLSCTMAPAWDEREFTLGQRAELLREFPQAAPWIHALTR